MKIFGRYEIVDRRKAMNQLNSPGLINKLQASLLKFGASPLFFTSNKKNYIRQAYKYNSIVYSVIDKIGTMGSQIPWVLYEVVDERMAKAYSGVSLQNKSGFNAKALRVKALKQTTHPQLSKILEHSSPNESFGAFIKGLIGFYNITGDAFAYGLSPDTGPNKGRPYELYYLPSDMVVIEAGKYMGGVSGYRLELDYTVNFTPEEVMHVKRFNPDFSYNGSWLYGQSPLEAAARSVQASNDNITAKARLYQNIGAIGMLADETDDGRELTAEQIADLQRKHEAQNTGIDKFGKIIVTNGKWKWHNFGLSPVDLGLLDAMKMDLIDICNVFGFPSQLMNDSMSTKYNTYNEAKKAAYTECVLPILDAIKDGINRQFVSKWNSGGKIYYAEPDLQAVPELQEDFGKLVTTLGQANFMTYNEKRLFIDYEPMNLENMDKPLVPANLIPIDEISISQTAQGGNLA